MNKLMLHITEYLDTVDYLNPIYVENIYEDICNKYGYVDKAKFNTYMTRLSKTIDNLIRYKKGVYYKAKNTPFGYAKLDVNYILRDRYLVDNENIIGYETGPTIMHKYGFTTQIPKDLYIASNKIKTNRLDNNIRLIKPKIWVTKDNYRYLQILDIIENKYNVKIERDGYIKSLIEIIEKFDLDLLTLVEYALEYDDVVIRQVASLVKEIKNGTSF